MSLTCNSGGIGTILWSAILKLKVLGRRAEGLTSEITQGEGSARANRLPKKKPSHGTLWLNECKRKKMKGRTLNKESLQTHDASEKMSLLGEPRSFKRRCLNTRFRSRQIPKVARKTNPRSSRSPDNKSAMIARRNRKSRTVVSHLYKLAQ